jgi:signal peptidase I
MNIEDKEDHNDYVQADARLSETNPVDVANGSSTPIELDGATPPAGGDALLGDSDSDEAAAGVASKGQTRSRHVLREIIETVVITLLVFVVVRSVIQNFKVEGDSMLPTLHSDQYLLVNKALYFRYDSNFLRRIFDPSVQPDMHYLFHGPQRGDIVVFLSPTEPQDFIKRVVAVAGETVEIRADPDPIGNPNAPCGGCGVYVNGVKLDEPYVKATPNYTVGPTVVPEGDVYVLGDNRRNSDDSHVWGPLDVNSIVGTAFLSYWPLNQFGLLPHPSYSR